MRLSFDTTWVLETVSTWPPKRRYTATVVLMGIVFVLWWFFCKAHLQQSLSQFKIESQQLNENQEEFSTISDKLLQLPKQKIEKISPSSFFAFLIEAVNNSGLELQNTRVSDGSSGIAKPSVELDIAGSFEQYINFLEIISKATFHISIVSCTLKRFDDNTVEGKFFFSSQSLPRLKKRVAAL
jgi:Tfp pilus assembly protein PilO